MADYTDLIANKKRMVVQFYHLPSGKTVEFKAFLTQYSDQFESNWNSEDVYGRMDPLETFQGTRRVISLGWAVPSHDFKEAKKNLAKASLLISMLYPAYEKGGGTGAMSAAPLFRMKFVNLIAQPGKAGEGDDVKTSGLVGRIGGFVYEPDIESGFFVPTDQDGVLFPQTINLDCEFTVFHTHELGWNADDSDLRTGTDAYPYNEGFPTDKKNKRIKEASPRTDAGKEAAADEILLPRFPGGF